MMHGMMSPPPSVPGITEGIPSPDPMRMLAMMMQPPSGTGMQQMMAAITALKQASKADPRMQDQIAEALRILTQCGCEDDHEGRG